MPANFSFDHQQLRTELGRWILSASGWRAVCAGDEVDATAAVAETVAQCVTLAAYTFARYGIEQGAKTIVLGTDTRPTGATLIAHALRGVLAAGADARLLEVCASPEIMAYAKMRTEVGAFFYLTASHNPIGHNGIKFGLGDGAVLGGPAAAEIARRFRALVDDGEGASQVLRAAEHCADLRTFRKKAPEYKRDALEIYHRFALQVAADGLAARGDGRTGEEALLTALRGAHAGKPLGIVADLNGSARTRSIDRGLFSTLGVRARWVNDIPGRIAHGILPEGLNLNDAAQHLRTAHALDPAFQIAYVPDNDGDRGNLVFIDITGEPYVPSAQEVFALVLVGELCWLTECGVIQDPTAGSAGAHPAKVAVVVNDPTSLRVDRICAAFGVDLYRAEVGEANVVSLAGSLREQGYTVRVCGEGSNGGNITFPSTVRDPINTVMTLVKMRAFGLHRHWALRSGSTLNADAGIAAVCASLPAFDTTATGEPRALLPLPAVDGAALMATYAHALQRAIPQALGILAPRFRATGWWIERSFGTQTVRIDPAAYHDPFGGRGGFKVVFADPTGTPRAFVWMRGSGTEAVFRVLADVEGDADGLEAELLGWHRHIIERAANPHAPH